MLKINKTKSITLGSDTLVRIRDHIYYQAGSGKTIITNLKTLAQTHFDKYVYRCHSNKYLVMTTNVDTILHVYDVINQVLVVNNLALDIKADKLEVVGEIVYNVNNNGAAGAKPVYVIKLNPSQPRFPLEIQMNESDDEIVLSTIKNVYDTYECRIKTMPSSKIIDSVEQLYEILTDAFNGTCGNSISMSVDENTPKVILVINYKYLVEKHEFILQRTVTDPMGIMDNKLNYLMAKIKQLEL